MPGKNLTREEAMERAELVTVKNYQAALDLTQGDTLFGSETTINFTAKAGASTFLDLVAENVHSVELNGQALDVDQVWADDRIALPELADENTVTVKADCRYMHTGEGLHRFVDPVDGEAYTYSQFEVPDARRVYATFEQPNLKATFQFTVTTPKHWTVFSNSATPEPRFEGDKAVFEFAPCEKISTYITAIVAGPYVGKTGELTSADGRTIPLGVYCRPSLEEYLDADEIMDITRRGFKFFEAEYGHPYPFSKYDQIFVPEYNAGAMENAGCVTFRDEYLWRVKPTEAQIEGRANTILHELAHMWFGDLVTMNWWNDLWLNESFAEYMSHLALTEATRWEDAWTGFMLRKDWGMGQDQLPTTHPIVANIRDLEDVETNFDGITYAKGAAVLRQLASYVGRDAFTEGLRKYFEANAWGNTVLNDLLSKLEEASGRDLSAWAKVWLEEAGVNLMRSEIETDADGNMTKVAILQESFNAGASLRPHRMAVGGYTLNEAGTEMERVFHVELDVDGERTEIPELVGKPRPDVFLLNDDDLTYTKVRLDEASLEAASQNIDKFTQPLPRGIIMASAWDMTRDAEWAAAKFVQLALRELPVETNSMLTSLVLRNLSVALNSYVAPADRPELYALAGGELAKLAQAAEPGSDLQRQITQIAFAFATTDEQLAWVADLYEGKTSLEGLEMDVELKWLALDTLVANRKADEETIVAMEKEDPTLTGSQRAARARASKPGTDHKIEVFDRCMTEDIANDTRIAMMQGLWAQSSLEPEMYRPLVKRYFENIKQMWKDNSFHSAQTIAILLFPPLPGEFEGQDAVVTAAKTWLEANPESNTQAGLRRVVSERLDALERSERVQAVK
ncbi:aminopeptidase N [Boudabousia tangfeifanii]|uniref:Aminopeptidase N n=1 Tax=Boudabousia tangfeifanii TaxID=1912795 RepID=A0A1D9MJ33_9ACTO|nr:aminopeptidase N [Boudabousia tangfeifanii]AOZ72218.1 aminopeptidase N [Boudabousia tangfeifanii]